MQRRTIVGAAIVALSVVVSLVAFPRLPETIAVHWNVSNEPDGTMSKTLGLAVLPATSAGLLLMFEVIPRIDPLGENIQSFRKQYDGLVWVTLAILLYVHVLLVLWNDGARFAMGQAIAPAVGAFAAYVGVVLEAAQRNWFVGIRTPWTLSSDEVWRRVHERGATLFKIAGGVSALGVFVPEPYTAYVIAVPLAGVALYLTVYSYVAYRRVDPDGDVGDSAV